MDTSLIVLMFRTPSLIKSLGSYLGLVESTDKKLEKLLSSDFNAGIRLLREVSVSTSKQHDFLLHEAWRRFHTALTHESGERKALTYLGLAFCQDRLGEPDAALSTLKDLSDYRCIDAHAAESVGGDVGYHGVVATGGAVGAAIAGGAIVAAPVFLGLLVIGALTIGAKTLMGKYDEKPAIKDSPGEPTIVTISKLTVADIAEQARYLVDQAEQAARLGRKEFWRTGTGSTS